MQARKRARATECASCISLSLYHSRLLFFDKCFEFFSFAFSLRHQLCSSNSTRVSRLGSSACLLALSFLFPLFSFLPPAPLQLLPQCRIINQAATSYTVNDASSGKSRSLVAVQHLHCTFNLSLSPSLFCCLYRVKNWI